MKKKGFTLIELLAVIVILAIIALIAVPVIMNIISSARKSAFEDSMYGIVKAGELYYAEQMLYDGMTEDVTFTFTEDGVNPSGLNIKGSLPTSGSMTITKDGKIILNATDGTYTATKGEDSSEISVVKGGKVETPEVPSVKTLKDLAKTNDFATSIDACATTGICAVGTKFAIEVAPSNIQNFYVVSDVNNKVTLIMDSNIGETVEWIDKADYLRAGGVENEWTTQNEYGNVYGNNNKGPLTAINYLESQTANWTNIPQFNYTYTDENETKVYSDIIRTQIKARLITKSEISSIISNEWSYSYLDTGNPPFGYWTSCADTDNHNDAWFVSYIGATHPSGDGVLSTSFGVRPVIEISK